MTRINRTMLIGLVFTLCLPAGSIGQSDPGHKRSSFGLRLGYAFFANDWNKVRYLPDVNLFKGNITIGGDLELPLSDRLSLAIDGGYQPLDGGDWEAYARARGDDLRVSASFGHAGILLRPYLRAVGPNVLKLTVGPVLLFRSGSELFNGMRYDYDFFNSIKFGGMAGIEYDHMLGEDTAAMLRFDALVVPSGVGYADGENRTVVALPLTVGLRFSL